MEVAEPEQGQLGRYRIGRTLGAGGMGVVYLAEDTRLHRQVAIKKLRKDSTSASAGARIQSEAQLLAQLNHPNIVQLHDVLEEDDGIALVMEYVEGTTLKEWMREHNAPLRDKLGLLIQICSGLNEAHSLGIIHRDLKPDNILITFGGTAKITDFGIAKSLQQSAEQITREDHVAGTVDAMSPEQLQGFPLGPRSDLFSLGAIAYELLCGSKPFTMGEGGSMALAQQVVNEPHIPPQQTNPNLPDPLAALLDRLLLKDPGQRPESALQVHEALEFLHQHLSTDTGTREFSDTVTKLLRKPPSARRRTLRAVAVTAGLAAVGVAGYFGWDYATRLDPQYIAVLPVEIHGEVRGEDNAKELTATMVRQALMNAASQLKASALVSFTPKDGQDFDAQLTALRDKGVTDALYARLDCAQVRCEIELQRIWPEDNHIKQKDSFTFLTDMRRESDYRITNATAHLFDSNYLGQASNKNLMTDEDYNSYLNIITRAEKKDLNTEDLTSLKDLISKYPLNLNLYRAYTSATTNLYVTSTNIKYIHDGLEIISQGKSHGISEPQLLELELWLSTYEADKTKFEKLLPKLRSLNFPPAEVLNKYARFLYIQGKYVAGLEYARKASDLNPSAENLYLIALNQYGSGNYADAIKSLNQLTNRYPNHWQSYATLGAIFGETGDYIAAEASISKIPEKFRNWRNYSNLGAAYFVQKQYQKALTSYLKALELAPQNLAALGNIAELYVMENNVSEYQKYYRQLLSLTNDSTTIEARTYHLLALAYLDRTSEAISLAHKLNQDAPDDTYVKHAAAQIYALAGEYRSSSYYVEQLLDQGMGADWFSLPAFQQLCTHPGTSEKVTHALCN